ncbi:MAG: hypothetical protein R2856_07430 [Caldilineaceae bacterium]
MVESRRQEPPIFVRHIHPVDVTVSLRGAADDVFAIVDAAEAELASLMDPDMPFSVQTRILADLPYKPFDVNRAVSQRLQELSGALPRRTQAGADRVNCLRADGRRQR